MTFLSLVLLAVIAYLLWRISDQLPDVLFRLGEIQRDIADIRKATAEDAPECCASNVTDSDGTTKRRWPSAWCRC